MAERKGEPEGVVNREPYPVKGTRKPPSEPRKGLPPKQAAEEPMHAEASGQLLNALDDVDFPATRDEVLDKVQGRVVSLGDGRTIEVETVVRRIAGAEFASAREIVSHANALWDDIDRAAHGG